MTASPLPWSGTVTFLFSDIEGSTRLEQAIGTRTLRSVCANGIARSFAAAFAAHGGIEQGTEGDSFFVVFGSARDAVAAAVNAQRGLAGEPWPPDATIRVRMGLHSGEAGIGRREPGRAGHQPGGADRGRCSRGSDPPLGRYPCACRQRHCPTTSACGTSASTGCVTWPDRSAWSQLERRRSAGRIPGRSVARRPPEQPADPADHVRWARSRARRGARPADANPAADHDRTRRHRQDAALPPGRRRSRRPTSRTASGSWPSSRSAMRHSSRRRSPGVLGVTRTARPDRRSTSWPTRSEPGDPARSSTTSSRSSPARPSSRSCCGAAPT